MKQAYEYLLKDVGLKYNDYVIIGVSGGPDSMALLHLLLKLKKAMDIKIVCAQINHNTGRQGQSEEQLFVENYCKVNGIIIEKMTIEKYGDDNFHNEARNIRYKFFNELIKKYKSKYLFTAHHGDDLIETILMRIVRGSTLKGYSGFNKVIKQSQYKIIRPLINVTKDEIIEYLKDNKVKYMVDNSNSKDVYTRNRFRKYIVPQFKKEDKLVHHKFYKFSEELINCSEFINRQTSKILKEIYVQKTLNIDKFKNSDSFIQRRIIYAILESIYQDDLFLVSDIHVDMILNIINNGRPNCQIHLPNNILVIKTYNNLVIVPTKQNEIYEIQFDKFINLPNGKNIELINENNSDSNFICRLNSKELTLPLYARTRKDGDKMTIKGMLGSKKINDIFIDNKISLEDRNLWPLLLDSKDNIVWLPGLKKSKFNKSKDEFCDIILRYY